MRTLFAFVLATLLAVPGTAAAQDVYKIGAIFSITGPGSSLGIPERDTAADEHLRDEPQLASLQGVHRLERARNWGDAVRAASQARGISNALTVTVLPRVGHDFASCDRKGELAARVMDFFERLR